MHQSMYTPALSQSEYLRIIFRYLTSERAAGIGDFDLFCMSSMNSRGVDQGIFHQSGLGQESLVWQDGTTNILYHLKSIVCRDMRYLTNNLH